MVDYKTRYEKEADYVNELSDSLSSTLDLLEAMTRRCAEERKALEEEKKKCEEAHRQLAKKMVELKSAKDDYADIKYSFDTFVTNMVDAAKSNMDEDKFLESFADTLMDVGSRKRKAPE